MRGTYLGVVAAAALLLTSCAAPEKEQKAMIAETETVTLEFYTWKDEEEYMIDIADAFMEEHPHITVHVHAIPGTEYRQKLDILFYRDRPVDVFTSSKPSVGEINAKKGYAADLTPYVEQLDVSGYGDWFEDLKTDGRIQMLPYRMSSWVVYYNKNIFDNNEIPYPDHEWTWEEYTEIAKKLTGEDEDGDKIYGSMSFDLSGSWWRVPARTTGEEHPLEPRGLEELKRAAWWSYQMAYEYQVQPRYTEFTSVDSFDYNRMFLQGNTGMFFNGEWCLPILNAAIEKEGLDIEYDVAPMPHWEGEESCAVATAAVMQVSSQSDHPMEALAFAKFVCGEKGAKILASKSLLPAWSQPEIQEIFKASMEMPQHTEYFFNDGKISQILPDSGYEESLEIVRKYVNQYLLLEISLEQAFQRCKEEMEEKGLMSRR